MTFEIAKREAVPLIISLAGTSGSGKTYSALLLASGIAKKGEKIGFIDTEMGRGSMYADDPDIVSALPDGEYSIRKLTEPFSPANYINAIKEAIKNDIKVLIIDSITHEWEGFGGCQDIAENNKLRGMPNWALGKMEHKKLMNILTQSPMHIIFCLRAREKSKPVKNPETGKITIVDYGLQPIQEKGFMYDMTIAMLLNDEEPGKPKIFKTCPKPLRHIINDKTPLISKDLGIKLREWSDGGEEVDKKLRNLKRVCREMAMSGTRGLNEFFKNLDVDDKNLLSKLSDEEFKLEVRELAKQADIIILEKTNQEKNDN